MRGRGTATQLRYKWRGPAWERMSEGQGAGEPAGLALRAVPKMGFPGWQQLLESWKKTTGASGDALSAGKAQTSCDRCKSGLQLRSARLGRLPPPAAVRQHVVLQIASLAQANGPSSALVPPGCCSLLQERMMIAQSVPARWGRGGVGRASSGRPLPCRQGGTEVVRDPSDVTHGAVHRWLCGCPLTQREDPFSQFNIKDFPSGVKGAGWRHPSPCQGWPSCKVYPQYMIVGY